MEDVEMTMTPPWAKSWCGPRIFDKVNGHKDGQRGQSGQCGRHSVRGLWPHHICKYGSHPQHSDDSRHCVPTEGLRGLCLEPTSNGSTEYCALRTTAMRKGFYLMPQVKCGTSEDCHGRWRNADVANENLRGWTFCGCTQQRNFRMGLPWNKAVTPHLQFARYRRRRR